MKSVRRVVLDVLAAHAGRDRSCIFPWENLEHDLDMTPLELVLVVIEVEGIEGVALDVTELDGVRTVAELTRFVGREVSRARMPSPRPSPAERERVVVLGDESPPSTMAGSGVLRFGT